MDRRAFVTSVLSPLALSLGCGASGPVLIDAASGHNESAPPSARERALEAMKRAARFMAETVAYKGGYVWSYLPDFSRRWGELEANPSMIWLQPPGTPSVGHVYLDAFHATGDRFYLNAAAEVASAVIASQHESGGFNYAHDFAGKESLARWYATVAKNGWRLEEFQQHPDNATFDDACTAVATQFLLRMQVASPTSEVTRALRAAVRFVTVSQYPTGGWPQRYPLAPDYTSLLTFNDDVLGENIRSLLMIHGTLSDMDVLGHVRAAMDSVYSLQQPAPQPGWGLQHDLEGRPAAARSFEPAALATHTTGANVEQLLGFHELTGDAKYLSRVPEAIAWLRRVQLPPLLAEEHGGTHPTFIEIGSGDAIHVHRRGSNVVNGKYYWNKTFAPRLSHYSPVRKLDLAALEQRLEARGSQIATAEGAPLLAKKAGSIPLPRYFSFRKPTLTELCLGQDGATPDVTPDQAMQLCDALDERGRWLAPLELTSNPYRGPGDAGEYTELTYASTNVGDRSDTSPYRPRDRPATYPMEEAPLGISVGTFIRNMSTLIAFVSPIRKGAP